MNESTIGFGDGASLSIGAPLGKVERGSVTGGERCDFVFIGGCSEGGCGEGYLSP
jgi:hypothetical protein